VNVAVNKEGPFSPAGKCIKKAKFFLFLINSALRHEDIWGVEV
jgi:hypothetical protein